MIIKKFQAKTEDEAIQQAKAELGTGIVVMNVRNVKKKGLFSFLRAQLTEITVALEEEGAIIPGPNAKPAVTAQPPKSATTPAPAPAPPRPQPDAVIPAEDINAGPSAKNSAVLEEKLDSLQSLLEQQLSKPEEEKEKKDEATESGGEENTEMLVFLRLLYNKMLDNEINEKYANQIIDEVDKNKNRGAPFDHALSHIYQKMILKFENPQVIAPAAQGPKVIFFVGPTGVGKTTTIAKVASRFSVDDKKKVALLTTDTYRIAAAEQLKTYANILEVPFRVIYAQEEIEQAMGEFADYDYIIVDTAGHSHLNKSQRKNVAMFIEETGRIAETEVYLVLSATTKYRDLIRIAESYKDMADYKLIFTKLDETETLGNLLNLKLYTGACLSYVTCGQNVPDDIEVFNPQKTVKMLLGGR